MSWTAIVPVKPWNLSKTRLSPHLQARAGLARAFALDTLDTLGASTRVGTVVVVTAEPEMAAAASALSRAVVREDRPLLTQDRLNAAVGLGRSWALSLRPTDPVVVVPADLPALRVEDLDATLDRLAVHERAHVVDADGRGTTLVAASRPALLRTVYGRGSGAGHGRDGSQVVLDVDPRVRRDVDRPQHLEEARRLGLAPRARRVVEVLSGRVRVG